MASEEVGRIYVSLDLDDSQFTSKSKQAEKQSRSLKDNLDKVAVAGVAMGVAAGLALRQITQGLKEAVDASNYMESAVIGVSRTAEAFGYSAKQAEDAARNLAKDGLMNVADASMGLKNLLQSGFSLPEAIRLMENFKDTASFGRQSALTFGRAIVSATEGVKNGNSILVDNAGITKNLSRILQEAGYAETDLMKVKEDAGIRQAMYNGLLKEGIPFMGDAAVLAGIFQGKQADLNNEIFLAKVAIGDALKPALADLIDQIKPVVESIKEWAEKNPDLVRKIATFTVGILAAVSAVGALSAAWLFSDKAVIPFVRALGSATSAVLKFAAAQLVALGPWGWIALAIAAVGAAVYLAYRKFEGFRNVVDQVGRWLRDVLWPVLKDVARVVMDSVVVAFKWLSQVAMDAWDALVGFWNTIKSGVISTLETLWDITVNVSKAVWDFSKMIVDNVISGLVSFWQTVKGPVVSAVKGLWDIIVGAYNAFVDFYSFLGPPIMGALQGLVSAVKDNLWPALQQLGAVFSDTLVPAVKEIWQLIQKDLWPALQMLGDAVADAVVPIFNTLSDLWSNVLVPAGKEMWRILTEDLWPALQELWDIVSANLIPVFEALRDVFVDTIVPALKDLWDMVTVNVLPMLRDFWDMIARNVGPILERIGDIVGKVVDKLADLWAWIGPKLIPALKIVAIIIGAAVAVVFIALVKTITVVIKVLAVLIRIFAFVLKASILVTTTIIKALIWYISNVVIPVWTMLFQVAKTVFDGIALAVSWLWNSVLKPIWDILVWYITGVLIPVWKKIWDVAKAVFNGIAVVVSWVWNSIIKPIWDLIWAYITTILIPAWKKIFEVAKVVWDGIATAIKWVWENVLKPIWDFIKMYITEILIPVWKKIFEVAKDVFNKVKDAIVAWVAKVKENFNKVKEFITGAINKFKEIKQKITDALKDIKDAIIKPFKKAFDWIKDKIEPVKDALNKLNPFNRNSPSLVDWITKGTAEIQGLYGNMFSSLDQMSSGTRGAMTQGASGFAVSAKQTASGGGGGTVILKPQFNSTVPYSDRQMREAAENIVEAANQILRSKGAPEIGGGFIKGGVNG